MRYIIQLLASICCIACDIACYSIHLCICVSCVLHDFDHAMTLFLMRFHGSSCVIRIWYETLMHASLKYLGKSINQSLQFSHHIDLVVTQCHTESRILPHMMLVWLCVVRVTPFSDFFQGSGPSPAFHSDAVWYACFEYRIVFSRIRKKFDAHAIWKSILVNFDDFSHTVRSSVS